MSIERVLVHGAGRHGADAWPGLSGAAHEFVSLPRAMSIAEQTDLLGAMLEHRRAVVFAHSIGAVPVVLLAASARVDIAGLVLVEPALYDAVRGDRAVEHHIAAVSEARAQAADGNLRGCWAILRPLMFGRSFEESSWEDERSLAERWSTTNLPWGHGIRTAMLSGIPTLVVTGGWNAEYELIARRMAEDGATHRVLTGAEHRPQDLPRFPRTVEEFVRKLARFPDGAARVNLSADQPAAARSPTR